MSTYLDRAIGALRSLNIAFPQEATPAPVIALLDKLVKYDTVRVTSIAATLQQSSNFNAVVREQIQGMDISTRYQDITAAFDSVREDAQAMLGWMADGRLDFSEKVKLKWMEMRRGSVPDRFNDIKKAYLAVAESTKDQISREDKILEAYRDFRMALKTAEVEAQGVLKVATEKLDEVKRALTDAGAAVEAHAGDNVERVRLELVRDEALRAVQDEDKAYQIAKDIADDIKTGYNAAELVFARLQQTHAVKERLYQRAVSFFATNEVVLTGLAASFTSSGGLAEATNAVEAMKDGMNKGLEALATTGGAQLEAGLRTGYGATLKTSSVKALADAIVGFQSSSLGLIDELRKESSRTAQEIEDVTEDSKRRFAALLQKAA